MILDSTIESVRRHLRDNLTHERYRHCLSVMTAMARSAETYGLDVQQASLAGLAHDIAKELPDAELTALLAGHDPDTLKSLAAVNCLHNVYLHGPAAVPLIIKLFDVTDREVLTAVRQHVGDYPDMGLLARCLFVADMTAPTVSYPGVPKLSKLYFSGRLDEAELLLIAWLMESNTQRDIPAHPQFLRRRQELNRVVKPGPDFFSRETFFLTNP